jgi:excisionase family DNA binding protein
MDATSQLSEAKLPALCRVNEVADHLRLSRSSVYGLMAAGTLRFVKIGRARRIRVNDVLALIENNTTGDVSRN